MGEHLNDQDIRESRESLLREIGEQSRVLQNEWDKVDEAVSGFMGINRTDMRVLDVLERLGPLTAGRLAQLASLSTGAVTAVIDRLESAGHVHRMRDPHDRRRVIVEIDRSEARRYQWIYDWVADEAVRRMERLSLDQLRAIRDFLTMARQLSAEHAEYVRSHGPDGPVGPHGPRGAGH